MKKIFASILVFCSIILSFIYIINYYHTWLKYSIIKAIEKNTEYNASLGNVRIELPNRLILTSLYLRRSPSGVSSYKEDLSSKLYIKKAIIIFSFNKEFRLKLKKIIIARPILSINCKTLKDLHSYIISTLKDNEHLYDIHPFDIKVTSGGLNIFVRNMKSSLVFDKIFLNYSLYKKEGNFKFCPSRNTLIFGKITNNNIFMNISSKDIAYLAKLLSLKNIYLVDSKRKSIKGKLNITLINDSFRYTGHIKVEDIKFLPKKAKNYIYIKTGHFIVNNGLFILKCSAIYKNIPFKTYASFRNLDNIKIGINTASIVIDKKVNNNNLPIDIGKIKLFSSFDGYLIDKRKLTGRVIFLALQEEKKLFKLQTQLVYKNNYLYLSGIKTQDRNINNLYVRIYLKDAKIQYLDAHVDRVSFRNSEVTGRLTYNNKDKLKFSLKIKPISSYYDISSLDINYLDNKLYLTITQTENNLISMVIKKEIDKSISVISVFKDFKINNNLFICGHMNSQLEGDLNSCVGQIKLEDIKINNERIRNLAYKIYYNNNRISLISSTSNLPNLYFNIKNLITTREINLDVYYGDTLKTYVYICLRDDKIHTSIHSEIYENEYRKVAEANLSGDILPYQNYASLFVKNLQIQNFIFKDGKLNISLSRNNNKIIFSGENIKFINPIYTPAHGRLDIKATLFDNKLNFGANIVYLRKGNKKNNIIISKAIFSKDILHIKSALLFQSNASAPSLKITDLYYKIPDSRITCQVKASKFQIDKYFINADYLLTGIIKDIYSKELEFVCKINNLNINNNDFVLRDGNLCISSQSEQTKAYLLSKIIYVNDYIFKNPNISIIFEEDKIIGMSNNPIEIDLGFLSAKKSHLYFKFTNLKHTLADLFISFKIKDARFTSPFEYYHNKKTNTLAYQGINKIIIEFIADENVYYHTAYLEAWIEKGSHMRVYKDGDKGKRFSGEIIAKRGRLNYFGKWFDVVAASLSIKEVDKLPYLKLLAHGRTKDLKKLILSYDGKLFAEKVELTAGSYRDLGPNKAAIFLGLDAKTIETMKVEELLTLGIAKILGYRISKVMEPIEHIASKLLDLNLRITIPFEELIYKRQYSILGFELSKYINKDLYMNLLIDINPADKRYYLYKNTLLIEYYINKNTVLEYKFEKKFGESRPENKLHEISIKRAYKF